jgi:hypothetical protein
MPKAERPFSQAWKQAQEALSAQSGAKPNRLLNNKDRNRRSDQRPMMGKQQESNRWLRITVEQAAASVAGNWWNPE